jgi:hypothetical protein
MRATKYAWISIILSSGCVPPGSEFSGSPGSQIVISEDMGPDPNYQPRVGDRAVLFYAENRSILERMPLLKDVTAYDIYIRCVQNRDAERLADLELQGWLRWVPPGSRVSVYGMQDRTHTGAQTALQVRVADEQYKNQTFWVPSAYVTRLIHKEPQ